MHYFKFEVKEWVANTAHLSLEEEAAYLRLVLYYYDAETPIPNTNLQMIFRKCRVSESVGMAIMLEFFNTDGEFWRHRRCDAEIDSYHGKQAQSSRAGKVSAERRFNDRSTTVQRPFNETPTTVQRPFNDRSTTVQPITNQESRIINQESLIKNQGKNNTSSPDGDLTKVGDDTFERFWLAYPKKVGKAAAKVAWAKVKKPSDTLNGIRTALAWQTKSEQWTRDGGQFIPNPATYLNQHRWLDEPIAEPAVGLTAVGRRAAAAAERWLARRGAEAVTDGEVISGSAP